LQRLFSTFPSGRPGVGLLLLRLSAGGFLIGESVARMSPMPPSPFWEMYSALVCAGACLCFGVWTPLVAGVQILTEMLMALSVPAHAQIHILLAVLAFSLALLGPGAWSVDSLMFGRKRIAL
jgi:hypothetical protein